jgi:hypothetical protein
VGSSLPAHFAIVMRATMRTSLRILSSAVLLLALSGCLTTRVVERWKDPSFGGPALHKVLVVSVQRDQGRRRLWEDSMVAALAKQGVQAEASYPVFPSQPPAPEQLSAMAARDGFDGVAATHYVRSGEQVRAYDGWGGWGWRGGGFGGWGPGWGGPWGGGEYIEADQLTDYQTDVYTVDPSGGKLVWTGITRSVDESSTRSVTDGISRALVPQLSKEGILAGAHH